MARDLYLWDLSLVELSKESFRVSSMGAFPFLIIASYSSLGFGLTSLRIILTKNLLGFAIINLPFGLVAFS